VVGWWPPVWWQRKQDGTVKVDRVEARELRNAAKQLLAGASLGSLIKDLNARGVPTSTGGEWTYAGLRQVLMRPRNAGLSALHGEIVGMSTFPPILTEDIWRAVFARSTGVGRPAKAMSAGMPPIWTSTFTRR
jgi:site-specific DNA recombinase